MPNFFSDGSPYLEHPLLTPERTASEVDFVVRLMDLGPESSILDVGCAFGRHSIELAKRGFRVVGIDPAEAMINAAREAAQAAGVDVTFQEATPEAHLPAQPYDGVIALFTVLGQITNSEDNRAILQPMAAKLKPGGHVLIEVPQRVAYKAMLAPQDRFGDDETYTQIRREYTDSGQILVEHFEIGSPDGKREFELSFRLFDPTELTALLTQAGFSSLSWFANYQGEPLQPESPFMLVHGRV